MNNIEDISDMTTNEIVELMQSKLPISLGRSRFSHYSALIEQKEAQSKPPSITELRKIEFEAVIGIAQAMSAYIPNNDPSEAPTLNFIYKNYEGIVEERAVIPKGFEFMSSQWHPEKQWVLVGHDLKRNATRYFAMKDIIKFL